jgi:DNA topoisomerase-1
VKDKRVARIVKASQDLPGQNLFEYVGDDDEAHPVRSEDVNDYLREISDGDFTAKDFRTWEATMSCALELAAVEVEGKGEAKTVVTEAIQRVAEKLGNTPAVCKKSYIHPGVIDEFLANGALELVQKEASRAQHALSKHEVAVIDLVERIIERESKPLSDLLARSVRGERAKKKGSKRSSSRKAA